MTQTGSGGTEARSRAHCSVATGLLSQEAILREAKRENPFHFPPKRWLCYTRTPEPLGCRCFGAHAVSLSSPLVSEQWGRRSPSTPADDRAANNWAEERSPLLSLELPGLRACCESQKVLQAENFVFCIQRADGADDQAQDLTTEAVDPREN